MRAMKVFLLLVFLAISFSDVDANRRKKKGKLGKNKRTEIKIEPEEIGDHSSETSANIVSEKTEEGHLATSLLGNLVAEAELDQDQQVERKGKDAESSVDFQSMVAPWQVPVPQPQQLALLQPAPQQQPQQLALLQTDPQQQPQQLELLQPALYQQPQQLALPQPAPQQQPQQLALLQPAPQQQFNHIFTQDALDSISSRDGSAAGEISLVEDRQVDIENNENDSRCIIRVMQVEEIVYDEVVQCQHTFTEECHDIYVTDQVPSQERKCDTIFMMVCQITYKSKVLEAKVEVCKEPLVRLCTNTTQGDNECSIHYETTCETKYNQYEVEQDTPNCTMVMERRCDSVLVTVNQTSPRIRRFAQEADDLLFQNETAKVGEGCKEYPVQKCTVDKAKVKKTQPDTSCQRIPKEICVPSNCKMTPGPQECHEEMKEFTQPVPVQKCGLEPKESCRMETVLVPKLVIQPHCTKVPKEFCDSAKTNPRKVSRPVMKRWCYKPSEHPNLSTRDILKQFFRR